MTVITELMEKKEDDVAAPSIVVTETQQCVTTLEGADVVLTMQLDATAGAPTAIYWTRGDQELIGERYGVSENNNTVHLSLQRASRADAGLYTLVAKNSVGEARRTLELRVDAWSDTGGADAPEFLRRLSDLAVKVGTRTRFLVEIRSSADIKVTWHHVDRPVVEGDRFKFIHEGNFFCVDVAPVTVEDGGRWTCMAESVGGRSSCSSHLNVLVPKAYKIPEFLEELRALLTDSGTVSLECKVVGVPTPVLRWYKDGKEIKAGDVFALTANPDDPTSLGTYTCEAVNCMGKTYSSSKVHVVGKGSREGSLKPADSLTPAGPPPIFTQDLSNKRVKIGEPLTLSCHVGVPPWPKSIAWYNKDGRVEESDKYHIMEDGLGGYMIETSAAETIDEGEWKCVATNLDGSMGFSTAIVTMTYPKNYRKPRFLESLKAILTEEGLVSFECKVVGFPTPQLRWFKDGQELKPGDVYQLTGTNSLGSYSCIAKNMMGEATSSAELTVEDIQSQLSEEERLQLFSTNQPPKFFHGLKSCEAKINEDFRLTVQVSISPEPKISWYRDDEQLEDSDRYHVIRENLGACHMDIRRLEIVDQAEWKCVATNDFGHSVTSCFLKLTIPKHFKKPRFLECLRAILSEEGAVNLECKVIGVPQPVLKWYKDGEELKPGDIHRIISGEDGRCCLGTYTCEAHNCMGTVASSASLLGFEERMLMKQPDHRPLDPGGGHPLARNTSLSTIHEERTSQMHDAPTERSLTIDERAEVSFSFDGKEVSVSLYETPDLTEEEALQVLEMYADELSEHVSEHNVVELPPLRFTKESSHSGNLLMEAVVIDVTHDNFVVGEDDLRTDADVEDLSISEAAQHPGLPHDMDDDGIFDELDEEFLDRALASSTPYHEPPRRPPRKKSSSRGESEAISDNSFHSVSGGGSKGLTDAAAPKSPEVDSKVDTFASARGSSGEVLEGADTKSGEAGKRKIEEEGLSEGKKKKDSEPKSDHSTQTAPPKKPTRSVESSQGESFENIAARERSLAERRKMDIPLAQETEKIIEETVVSKEEVKGEDISTDKKAVESVQVSEPMVGVETSAPEEELTPKVKRKKIKRSTSKEASLDGEGSPVVLRRKKKSSISSGDGEQSEPQVVPRRKKKTPEGVVCKDDSYSEEGDGLRTRLQQQEDDARSKRHSSSFEDPEPTVAATIQAEIESITQAMTEREKRLSGLEFELPRLQSPELIEQPPLAVVKGESSLIENLTQSLQHIQHGLASVEQQVVAYLEPSFAKSSLEALESLSQPISDIQKGLARAEEKSSSEELTPGKTGLAILETLAQPIKEFQQGLARIEQQTQQSRVSDVALERTTASILENVTRPLEEFNRGIEKIQQLAMQEAGEESLADVSNIPTFTTPAAEIKRALAQIGQRQPDDDESLADTPSLLSYATPPQEGRDWQSVFAQVGQSVLEPDDGSLADPPSLGYTSPIGELQKALSFVTGIFQAEPRRQSSPSIRSYATPPQELHKPMVQIGDKVFYETEALVRATNVPILQAVVHPVQDLQRTLNAIELQADEEARGDEPVYMRASVSVLEAISQPIEELRRGLFIVRQKATIETGEDRISHEILEAICQPMDELERAISLIEQQSFAEANEDIEEMTKCTILKFLGPPLHKVVQGLTSVEKNYVVEVADTLTGELPMLQYIEQSIKDVQRGIATVTEAERPHDACAKKSVELLSALARPFTELQRGIVQVERTIVLEQTEDVKTSSFDRLAQPLHELQAGLTQIEQFVVEMSTEMSSSPLESLAEPLHELKRSVALVQESAIYGQGAGNLATLAALTQPLQELQRGLCSLAAHPKKRNVDVVQSMTRSIDELQQEVARIEYRAVSQPPQESQRGSITLLGTLAEPLHELHRGLIHAEQILCETPEEQIAEFNFSSLESLTKPLHELREGLSQVERTIFENISQISDASTLEILTPMIHELQKGIAIVQQQSVMECESEAPGYQLMESLAQPLLELHRSLSTIIEEPHLEEEAAKTSAEILKTVTQSVKELRREISVMEEQPEAQSQNTTVSILKTLSEPLFELHSGLSQLEQQVFTTNLDISSEQHVVKALEVIAQPLQEITNQLICIENSLHEAGYDEDLGELTVESLESLVPPIQAFQRGVELFQESTKVETLGVLPEPLAALAKPLQELNKSLGDVENVIVNDPKVQTSRSAINAITTSMQAITQGLTPTVIHDLIQTDPQMGVLENLVHPLEKLLLRWSVIEEESTSTDSKVKLLALGQPVEDMLRSVTLVKERIAFESGIDSEPMKLLESLSRPIQQIQSSVWQIEDSLPPGQVAEKRVAEEVMDFGTLLIQQLQKTIALTEQKAVVTPIPKVSEIASLSMVEKLSEPLNQLQDKMALVESENLLAVGIEQLSDGNVAILKELAEPIEKLQKCIARIEEKRTMQGIEVMTFKTEILESLAQPMAQIHHAIALIEQQAESHADVMTESGGFSVLQLLAQPMTEVQRGLAQVEQQVVLEAKEEEMAAQSRLRALAHPDVEVQQSLSVVDQFVTLPSRDDTADKTSVSLLQTLAQPIHELQLGLAQVEQQVVLDAREQDISSNTSLSLLQALAQPIQELQRGLAQVEQQVVMEAREQDISDKTSVSLLQTLAQPLQELQRGLAQVEQQVVMEAREQDISDNTSLSLLQTLAQPIQELQRGLAQVEQQVVMEAREQDISDNTSLSLLQTLAQPIQELQRGLAQVEQQVVMEARDEDLSDKTSLSLLQSLAQPIQELQRGLAQVEQQVVMEAREEDMSDKTSLSLLQSLAQPIQELQRGLAQVEQQVVMEAREEDMSDKTSLSLLQSLAQPIQELQRGLAQVEQQVVMEAREEDMSDKTSLSLLQSLAQPIQELQRGLAQVEQQVVMEAREEDMSDKTSLSLLQSLAQPIQELQRGLAQVEQQVVMEAREEDMSDKTSLSLLQSLAQPIQELQRGLAQVEQQVVMEAREEDMSDKTSLSLLQSLAQPIQELQRGLAQVEQQVVMEAREEDMSDKTSLSLLQSLAQPIQELQRGLAQVEQQVVMEAREEDLSDKTSLSLLQSLAQPLQELQLGLAQIEQQVVLDAREEDLSDKTSLSLLQTLAQPIHELQLGLAQVEQQVVLEAREEDLSDKTSLSLLQTLAQPIHELQLGLAQVEQQVILEAREEDMSEKTSASELQTLAERKEESLRGVAQVQQQVVLEADLDEMSDQASVSGLKTLAENKDESLKEVATVEQQLVYEPDLGEMSDQTSLSELKTLAEGKEETLKEVAVTQQQLVFEPELDEMSDRMAMSDLKAVAEDRSGSQQANVCVEEQMLLEPAAEEMSQSGSGIQIWANPVQEVLKQLAVIQQQYAVEFSSPLSQDQDISGLRSLARPIQDLHQALIEIGEQIVMEGDTELSQKENLSLLATLAKPIQELQSGIAQISQQHLMEPSAESMSEKVDISLLKTLAQPLKELERKIILIEEQEVMEAGVEPMSEDETLASDLPTLASVDSMHVGVVEEQFAFDADVETISDLTDVEQTATTGRRSQREVAVVQEHEVFEGQARPMSASGDDVREMAVMQEEAQLSTANVERRQVLEDKEETEIVTEVTQESVETQLQSQTEEVERKRLEAERKAEDEARIESEAQEKKRLEKEQEEVEKKRREKDDNKRQKREVAERLRMEEEERVRLQDEEAEKCRLELEERIRCQEEAERVRQQEREWMRQQEEERQEEVRRIELQKEEEELMRREEEARLKVEQAQQEILKFDAEEKERGEREAERKRVEEEEDMNRKIREKETLDRQIEEDRKRQIDEDAEVERLIELEKAERRAKRQAEKKKEEEDARAAEKAEADRIQAEELVKSEQKKAEESAAVEKQKEEDMIAGEKVEAQRKEEAEIKKKEEEEKRKGVEAEVKLKEEAEKRRIEEEEKKKREEEEASLKEEAEKKKKEEAKAKLREEEKRKNEAAEAKLKEETEKKEKEEAEAKLKEEEKKKKEEAEAKLKEEAEIKKKEESEAKLKEEAEKKKKKEEAEAKLKEEEKRKNEAAEAKLKEEAEKKKKEEAEAKLKEEEKKKREEAEAKLKEEAEKKKKEEAEAKLKEEAEKKKKEEAETKLKEEEKKKREEAEAKLKEEAEIKKKEEAEAKLKEEEKKKKEEAEAKLKEEAKKKKKEEAAAKLKEEEKKKKEEAEAKLKEEAEKKKKEEAEAKLKEEEKKKKEEAEAKLKEEAEKKKKEEAEAKLKEEEKKKKEEAEAKLNEEAEKKKKEEAEAKLKEETEKKKKKKEEAEAKLKEEEKKKKEEAEVKLKEEAEKKKKERAEAKLKEEAEQKKKEAEAKLKEEEKKKKEEAEAKLKEEAEKKKKEEAEAKLKEEEKKKKEEAEAKLKEEAEKKKKEEAEAKLKEEEKKKKEEAEAKLKEEAEKKKKEEAEAKLKEETEKKKKKKEEAEAKLKEEEKKKKEEAEVKLKEEAEKKKKEQAEAKLKEDAEQKKKEAEAKLKEEEKKKKEEAEAQLKEEAEKKKKEEAEAKFKEEEKKKKEEAEAKLKEEAEKKKKKKADAKLKEDAEKKKREEEEEIKKKEEAEAEAKLKEEAEKKKEEADAKLKEEAEKKKKEDAEAKIKEEEKKKAEEAEAKLKEEAEKKKKEEADNKLKEDADIKLKEEAEKKKKEEAEAKVKEEAEKKKKKAEAELKEEAEKKKKEEEEIKKKEETEAKLKKEAEKKKKEEAEAKIREETEMKKKEEEEERRKIEDETKLKEETEKKKKDEEEKKKKDEAEAKVKEVAEKKKEEEEKRKKEEAEAKVKEEAEKKNKEEEKIKKDAAEAKLKEEAAIKKKEEEAKLKEESEKKKKKEEVAEAKRKEDAEIKLKEEERKKSEELSAAEERKKTAKSKAKKKREEADNSVCLSDQKLTSPKERQDKVEASAPEAAVTYTSTVTESHTLATSESTTHETPVEEPRRRRRPSEEAIPETPGVEVRRRRSRADVTEAAEEEPRRRQRPLQDDVVRRRQADVDVADRRLETMRRARSVDQSPWSSDVLEGGDHVSALRRRPISRADDSFSEDFSVDSRSRRSHTRDVGESGSRDAQKKPTFCTRLTDRTAAQGSRIKLMCSVLGSPEPTVEWLRDGLPVQLRQGDATKFRQRLDDGLAHLEVINASTSDSGEYTCVARNLHGETSTTASLRVFAAFEPAPFPPTFTRGIRDMYHFSDDELVLECRVRSQPPPRVTWLKDNVALRPSVRYQQTQLADGVCRLTISGPEAASDSGQYTCKAENAVWADQISHIVQFTGRDSHMASRRMERAGQSRVARDVRRPHFASVLTDHLVPSGGTIALQVEIRGTARPDVTWLRGAEPLRPDATSRVRTFEESGVYTLTVSDARDAEAGVYTCRATNAYGYVSTSAAVEVVRPGRPAMFMSRPDQDMSVALGEDVTVSFRVQGDPKPRVIWMKGTRDITNSQRSLKETLDDYVRLTLKRALPTDAGTYCILAKNVYGCDRAFVTVQIRQRARSLTPSVALFPQDTSAILRDVRENVQRCRLKDVPGAVGGEPVVVESGNNWLTLAWPKGEQRGGVPVIAYKVEGWRLGEDGGARWTEMGISPINSFDAFNLKPGSEYQFRVTPRNRYGWGESVTTHTPITVGKTVELPEFVQILPGQLKALHSSNIRLECQVRGDPAPAVQWYRDGTPLDASCPRFSTDFNGSQCRLSIDDLRDEDSGRYMCEATNKKGRVSTFARLLVVTDPKIWLADTNLKRCIQEDEQGSSSDVPPQFTMRLRDRRVQMTYPVRLTCQVAGRPTPQVTWCRDGVEIKQDAEHTFWHEEHFHTLELNHASLEDSGCYSATARNAHGAVSCRCHLVVDKGIRAYVAPDFLAELEPEVTVKEGGEIRLTAQVEAYPTVGVTWHRDGVRLRPSRRAVMTLNCDGRVELALAGATLRDAGVFTCTASNEVGRAETSVRVKVVATASKAQLKTPVVVGPEIPYSQAPLWITKPRSTDALEGDTVIIQCEVVGDPKPEVYWLRDFLKPDYYRDAPHFRRLGDGPQYRLEIPRAKLDFTGAYSVIARNTHGEVKAVISLQIYCKGQGKGEVMEQSSIKHGKVQTLPIVKRELKDLRCCDGDAVTLECSVHATPTPDVRWEKEGRLLPLGGDFAAEFDGETARLSVHHVYPEDEGEYTCVVYNELGKAATSACLVVDVPEEKETLLSQQLSRPPGLLSTTSTPMSTPRTTPSRSKSPSMPRHHREVTPSPYNTISRPRRLKVTSPKFYAVPHNRVAEEGETVRFQCAIAGHPTPWVTWDKDGVIVTPGARLTITEREDLRVLELSEVTVEDAGLYRITLENEVGRIEASARLEVIGHHGSRARGVRAWSASPRTSPTFGRRLIGSAARVGSRLTLDCEIRGTPSPIPAWYRNGELIVMSSRMTPTWDGRVARLDVASVDAVDAGVYCCMAENDAGVTQCSARVTVLDVDDPSTEDRQPPVFLVEMRSDVEVLEGHCVELLAQIHGSAPMEVVWTRDGVEVPDSPDFRHVVYDDGRVGLRLADAFPQDGGVYRCDAFNAHGDAATWGRLTVKEESPAPLEFTKRPTAVLASPGGEASFCARLSGTASSVRWRVADKEVQDDPRYKTEEDDDVYFLHICDVALSDAGVVTCTATSAGGGVATCSAALGVMDGDEEATPATLITGPADVTVLLGDRVVLTARYTGWPTPTVRWLRAGRELVSDGRLDITTEDSESQLALDDITADEGGKYVVSVENVHGADCHFASVAVEGPPDPPATAPGVSTSDDASSCVCAWTSAPYDGGCIVTSYRVEMRDEPGDAWRLVAETSHGFSTSVAGLAPGRGYVFRVRAVNVHGESVPSAESRVFQLDPPEVDGGDFTPAFEPRVVEVESGADFKERFEVLEELGKGRFGVVHKVSDRETGQKLAAKFIRCIKSKDREKVQEEIDIMNCLRHPKLLQLAAAFENPREIVMVMELISGGELFERVVADDFTLTERDCVLFMRQIVQGVEYMHNNNVVHLDLKPENIMCYTRTSHQIKLIDFGLAKKLDPQTPVRVLFGTPEFIPPEIINYEVIGLESDMWSVGVICYVLLSGLSPFMGDTDADTFANITRADFDFDDEAFDAISQASRDFISSLLVEKKEKRLTAAQCLQHTWLAQHDEEMSCVKLCTDKLKKFIIRRKWQKTGNAIRALGRMATLSASRRNSNASATSTSPRPSLVAFARLLSVNEEDVVTNTPLCASNESNNSHKESGFAENGFHTDSMSKYNRSRMCSERSDSGISDCSGASNPIANVQMNTPLLQKKFSISEEVEYCGEDVPRTITTSYSPLDKSSAKASSLRHGSVDSGFEESTKRVTPGVGKKETTLTKPTLASTQKKIGASNDHSASYKKAMAFWKP